jgi:hypothetical protein
MPSLPMPTDFPSGPFNTIQDHLRSRSVPSELRVEFAGGWNGLRYRFLTCTEHDEAFTGSIVCHGDAPPHPERYRQDRELFGFFVTGLAAIQCLCYSLFAVSAMLEPSAFPMTSEDALKKIEPERTAKSYNKGATFRTDPLADALMALVDDQAYKDWRNARNILAHRINPGRHIYASAGEDPGRCLDSSSRWKLDHIILDRNTTAQRRLWLANRLADTLNAAAIFITREMP